MMVRSMMTAAVIAVGVLASADVPLVTVTKSGAERKTVTIACAPSGVSDAFVQTLKKNLELSGYFQVGVGGTIQVTGTPGVSVTATGGGQSVRDATPCADARAARMAARVLSDKITEAFSEGGKGFAQTRLAFVNRKGKDNAELYVCYADGGDMRQLTQDGHAVVGPRWAPDRKEVYYTGFFEKTPLVYHVNADTGVRVRLASFKGSATGGAVSPNGRSCALVLSSYEDERSKTRRVNPELYVMDFSQRKLTHRLTETFKAAEASPCWSPDGKRIAYVSDQTRHPQVYIVDLATKRSVRFTSQGVENTNPDWSADGKLCWASKRAGQTVIMVADVAAGEKSAREVTSPGSWEHPSWAADGRHLVASRDHAIFLVDTDPDGDKPKQLFYNQGNWMNPAFSR